MCANALCGGTLTGTSATHGCLRLAAFHDPQGVRAREFDPQGSTSQRAPDRPPTAVLRGEVGIEDLK